MLGAIIGAAGSLLGGLLGSNSEKKRAAQERAWALEDQAEQFVRLREAADKGGFNPLTVLGVAPGAGMPRATEAASGNYMGKAIAESSLILADSYAKRKTAQEAAKSEALKAKNQQLQNRLTSLTLRPQIPGLYGGANGQVSPLVSRPVDARDDSVRPLANRLEADSRRVVDNLPITTDSGVIAVDNPNMRRFYVPAINGEVVSLGDIPTVIFGWAGTRATEWYQKNYPISVPDYKGNPQPWPKAIIGNSEKRFSNEGRLRLRNEPGRSYPHMWP